MAAPYGLSEGLIGTVDSGYQTSYCISSSLILVALTGHQVQ